MNRRLQPDRELLALMWAACDGSVTAEEYGQLMQRLDSEEDARLDYMRFVSLVIDLESKIEAENSSVLQNAPSLSCVMKSSEEASVSDVLARSATSSRTFSYFSRPVLQYAALVALCLYGSFVLVAWNLRPDKLPPAANGNDVTVALVSSAADVHWSRETTPKTTDSPVREGESLKIDSGLVQLELKSGAILVIEGPAEWSINGENRALLHAGRLVARVPKQAIGFTVDTPNLQVIDLGTEFGVRVEADGTTDVHVLKGQVELKELAGSKESASRTRKLSAGEAMRVVAGNRQAVRIPFGDSHLYSALQSAASLKRDIPPGEAISIIWLGNLFDDPRHTPLAKAVETDTFRAMAEIEDLGVERVLHGGDCMKQIAPQVWLDATNLGWDASILGEVSNDTWGVMADYPTGGIRTRGTRISPTEPKIEDGIGVLLDTLITFDLDEIRAAGGPQQGQQFEFVCDRAGINDDCAADVRASVQMVVLVSNARGVQTASVNGAAAQVVKHAGIWSVTSPIGKPLRADGRFAQFRVEVPADAKYLTLLTTGAGDGGFADHAVWSGARLEVQK